MADYNGWRNRETWLVNLYFGDSFEEFAREDFDPDVTTVQDLADSYEQYVEEILEPEIEGLGSFLNDYLDLGLINWYELAESQYNEFAANSNVED